MRNMVRIYNKFPPEQKAVVASTSYEDAKTAVRNGQELETPKPANGNASTPWEGVQPCFGTKLDPTN